MPLQVTSKQAAEDMALAAYNRALKLSGPGLWDVFFSAMPNSFRPWIGCFPPNSNSTYACYGFLVIE
jgi:hypothetical protein